MRWLFQRILVPAGVFAAGHSSPLSHNKSLCHVLSLHCGTPLRSIATSVSGDLFCKTQNAYDPMRCKFQYLYLTDREAEDGEGGSFAGGHPGPQGRGLALHFVWLWKPWTSNQGGCRGPESLSAVTARGGSILELTTGTQSAVAPDVWRRGLKKQTHTSTWLSGRDGALWEDPFGDGRISLYTQVWDRPASFLQGKGGTPIVCGWEMSCVPRGTHHACWGGLRVI